jgi:mitochondrial fission protein ELM1
MLDLWILTHRRVGDLEQMRSLASALAARVSEKAIVFHSARLAVSLPFLSPRMIDHGRSAALDPPWPDLVLVAEGALGNVALDIGRKSGGRTKVVCIGRPRGRMSGFDLIITTPQYRLPNAANVLELKLPLHRLDRHRMDEAAAALGPEMSSLPRPWVALLVGGTSAPDVLDSAVAQDLARRALAYAKESGGSLLVITSPRTGREAEKALAAAFNGKARCSFWSQKGTQNPYSGYLALADRFIVTSDSVSMVTEAILTKKHVAVYRLPVKYSKWMSFLSKHGHSTHALLRPLIEAGVIEARADRAALLAKLKEAGLIHDIGEAGAEVAPLADDMGAAVQRIETLLKARGQATAQRATS